jgi:hypothetical protein
MQGLRMQSPGMIKVGEFAAVNTIETYENGRSVLKTKESISVLSRFEDTYSFNFGIVYNRTDYRNGHPTYHTERGNVVFRKGQPTVYERLPEGYYYDLQVHDIELGIPELVRQRPDCGGLDDCDRPLPGRLVTFSYSDLQHREWRIEATGSHVTPFMGTPMSLCANDIQRRVTTCKVMVDFAVGR